MYSLIFFSINWECITKVIAFGNSSKRFNSRNCALMLLECRLRFLLESTNPQPCTTTANFALLRSWSHCDVTDLRCVYEYIRIWPSQYFYWYSCLVFQFSSNLHFVHSHFRTAAAARWSSRGVWALKIFVMRFLATTCRKVARQKWFCAQWVESSERASWQLCWARRAAAKVRCWTRSRDSTGKMCRARFSSTAAQCQRTTFGECHRTSCKTTWCIIFLRYMKRWCLQRQ